MEDRYESSDLQEALRVLRNGGIVLYPTDTVWGIGCDATNEKAVKKVFELKQRADSKSMLVLVDSVAKLERYVEVPEAAEQLLSVAEESAGTSGNSKPMTIIYPNAQGVAKALVAEDGSLGVRITNEAFSRALCTGLGKPIVSTSANISGEPAAKTFAQISEAIRNGVDYVCRYRRNDNAPKQPSSIIKINTDNTFIILRA